MSGESGDTSRPNVDAVNSQCDLVVEREVTQPYGYRVVSYRVDTTAYMDDVRVKFQPRQMFEGTKNN